MEKQDVLDAGPSRLRQGIGVAFKLGSVAAALAEVGEPACLALGVASMVAEEPPVDCLRAFSSGDYEAGGELATKYIAGLGKKVIKGEAIGRAVKLLFSF